MKKFLFVSLAFILLITACKNDLELNAEWKDITVVYGLLDQRDTIQYLKINKAYLGEGNALLMAQIPDSSTYYNNLDVKIEEWNNQTLKRTISFDTTTIYNKESGTFYFPNQVIYKSKEKLDLFNNENIEYRLAITNKLTGKIIAAKTKLISTFYVSKPFRNPVTPTIGFSSSNPAEIIFNPANNGKYYQVYFRFNYSEQDKNTMIVTNKYCDLFVNEVVYDNIAKEIKLSYVGENLYAMLKSKIPYNPNMIRKIKDGEEIELIIYVANDDFYTYMQAVKPSTGITQDKPEFTNIENGIGIFASRYYIKLGYNLSNPSLDSLYSGRYTKDLGFQQ